MSDLYSEVTHTIILILLIIDLSLGKFLALWFNYFILNVILYRIFSNTVTVAKADGKHVGRGVFLKMNSEENSVANS